MSYRQWLSYMGPSVFLLLTLVGLAGNVLVMTVWLANWKHFTQMTFYLFAVSLAVSDCGMLIVQLLVTIPLSYAERNIYGVDSPIYYFFASFDTLFYYCVLVFTFLVTFNRFCVFLWHYCDELLFEKPRVYFTILFGWLFCLYLYITSNIVGCHKEYHTKFFFYYYVCDGQGPNQDTKYQNLSTFGQITMNTMKYSSNVLPAIMFIMYVAILIKIKIGSSSNTNKHQKSLLIQSVIICVVLELETLMFTFYGTVASVFGDDTCLVVNSMIIINSSVNAFIFLTFNKDIRGKLASTLGIKTKVVKVAVAPHSPAAPTGTKTVTSATGSNA